MSLSCQDSLARTSGSPACSAMDFTRNWPVCELRTLTDTRTLGNMVRIAGAIQVFLHIKCQNFNAWSIEITMFVLANRLSNTSKGYFVNHRGEIWIETLILSTRFYTVSKLCLHTIWLHMYACHFLFCVVLLKYLINYRPAWPHILSIHDIAEIQIFLLLIFINA